MVGRLLVLLVAASGAGCSEYGFGADRHEPAPPGATPSTEDPGIDTETPGEDTEETGPVGETGSDETEVDTDTEPVDDAPAAGCADGAREGFLSWDDYPDIAACSGAWSVPGVTRPDLTPTCGHAAGDDSANLDGDGCSAADLCMAGWHVCAGGVEVAALAGSCDDAVPPGAPDKSLLFAVAQHSVTNIVCDDAASETNDVFGCGNLGVTLSGGNGCGPLNRALASTNPDSCGYNEAEPGLGPWECDGGADSHLSEGSLVTKRGCPGGSCSYDGAPVGSSDKGGVLCCRD
jgi:hypothetical protein